MYMYGRLGFPTSLTPVLILVVSLVITVWVCDGRQFSQATRVVCAALTGIIATALGVFVCTGDSVNYSAAVIIYESVVLAIQFVVSHIAYAAKKPS